MDAKTLEILTGAIFVIIYALIVFFYKKKTMIIWIGVALVFFVGAVDLGSAWASINWDVLGIYVGMLFIAEALIRSRLPDYLAIWFVNHAKHTWVAMLLVCAFTGFLSAVIENVACVLIVAPIIFSLAKKMNVSPVPMIFGAAISSNLQGVATLVGDPPSMLLAGHTGMSFNDFFFFNGVPGLFFAVQIGMAASLIVLYFFFRKYEHPSHHFEEIEVKSFFPTYMLVAMVVILALGSVIEKVMPYSAGIVCMVAGIFCLFWIVEEKRKNEKSVFRAVTDMDWGTAFFIIAVFIMVESLSRTGIIGDIAKMIYSITGTNLFYAFILIVVISMFMSGFIDNVPYVVAMLPVVQMVAEHAQASPYVLYFGLLIGASVGGNITPVGASANIVGVGLLRNRGYDTSFFDFVKMGLPFTIVAVAFASGFIWLVFG